MVAPVLKIEAWVFHLEKIVIPPYLADAASAARITNPARRRRYEQTRSALRRVLGLRMQTDPARLAFQIASGGKPYVTGCEFSISHSGPWLVVATNEAPIGVDIETHMPKQDIMKLATRFFSPSDVTTLALVPETQQKSCFIHLWVAKEAALKAAGTGLSSHLHKAECIFAAQSICAVQWDDAMFSVREFTLEDGTPGAIAWCGDGDASVMWRDPAEMSIK